jgi:thiamine pyrophosphate-dependent acetolactate synthase large subunit-like protein
VYSVEGEKIMAKNPYTEPNGAHYLLKGIRAEGVGHVFLVPGYMVEPFLSAFDEAGITPTIACQEGGAAYMADGYARARLSKTSTRNTVSLSTRGGA